MQDTRGIASILFYVASNSFPLSEESQIADLKHITNRLVLGGVQVGILLEAGSADVVARNGVQFDRTLFPSQIVWQTTQLSSLLVSIRYGCL